MNKQEQMLAKAFEAKLKNFKGTPQEFLKSIPNAVNLKENDGGLGIHSIQVMFSALDIKEVSTNGTHVLITSLT